MLEAGPDYSDFDTMPDNVKYGNSVWDAAYGPEAETWGYMATATPAREPFPLPRGKLTGGSSSVNGQVFFRGSRRTMTSGRSSALRSGRSSTCCRISASPRQTSPSAPTTSTGATGRFRSDLLERGDAAGAPAILGDLPGFRVSRCAGPEPPGRRGRQSSSAQQRRWRADEHQPYLPVDVPSPHEPDHPVGRARPQDTV